MGPFMPPGQYLVIMKVPGYRGMVVVLVNIDVTWVKVQGHLNKPFFCPCPRSHPPRGGRVDCYATPPHSLRNDDTSSPPHHVIAAYLEPYSIRKGARMHAHTYVHTYTRTLLATILLLPLLLHYPTLLLSCFNAIRRQLHSAWAPGAPELCRHPVRHPQVPATPHGRPHQPSATIPISCAPTLLGVFPVLNCGRTCCTCGRSAANIVSDDSNRIVNKKKVCLETHAPPVPLLTCCCYCEESRPP